MHKPQHHHKLIYSVLAILVGIGIAFFVSLYTNLGISYLNNFNTASAKTISVEQHIIQEILHPVPVEIKKSVEGLTMFRGNPTRTWYGKGPVPKNPVVEWKYPDKPMCALSSVYGETKQWCGNGWTGEPVVWERPDRITEVIFGAYDDNVHFVNAATGKDTRPPFHTGDLVKGSVTLDPDGYPLLYFGSRDNHLRILALDQDVPREIWQFDSHTDKGMWNDDWDSNPVVVNDVLYEGCENGYFYAFKLNRGKDANGKVTVSPKLLFKKESYTPELVAKTDSMQSIESSTLITHNRAYISNSGGHIMGFDISKIESGIAPTVFDYWTGDDTDATPIADNDGMLYIAVEKERMNDRSKEVGQLIKLDPYANNPFVWGIQIPGATENAIGGIWATPALYKNYLYVPTHKGELLVVDTASGDIVWKDNIGFHAWGSASVVDDTLVVPSCAEGSIRAYDVAVPSAPKLLWSQKAGTGCIESSPAVWKNQIFFGNRDGFFYKIGENAAEKI